MTVLRIGYALLLLTVLGLDAFCGSTLSAAATALLVLTPLAGVGADAALFVAISAALLGTLCAYAVRWSPTVCGLLLTVLSAALLALLRPDSAQVEKEQIRRCRLQSLEWKPIW